MVSPDYASSTHGVLGCRTCHAGNNTEDKVKAHEGIIKAPSANNGGICAECHSDITANYENSLHNTAAGIKNGLAKLAYPNTYENSEALSDVFANDCYKCHATCGDCHVRRPASIQGGLFTQHQFVKEAPIEDTCWGCHGARNAGEYIGNINGMAAISDIHYKKGLTCTDCHDIDNLHGSGTAETGMYELKDTPECLDCHEDIYSPDSKVSAHRNHTEETMSCQVCHSIPNNNCSSCHVKAEGGSEMGNTQIQFKIGKNPNRDEKHPYEYVVVRHIPTTKDMLDAKAKDLLPNFDSVSNWQMSPSHNIQLKTPQARNCTNCHGNAKMFLTEQDLQPDDSKATREVVVEEIPES